MPLCVQELGPPDREFKRHLVHWHVVSPIEEYQPGDWAPILCSKDEGIVLPGRTEERETDCPDCIRTAKD